MAGPAPRRGGLCGRNHDSKRQQGDRLRGTMGWGAIKAEYVCRFGVWAGGMGRIGPLFPRGVWGPPRSAAVLRCLTQMGCHGTTGPQEI